MVSTLIELATSRLGLLAIALGLGWLWHTSEIDRAVEDTISAANLNRQVQIDRAKEAGARDVQLQLKKVQAEKKEIEEKYEKLLAQKPFSKAADNKCVVPAGFVWNYDNAWRMPGLAGRPSDLDKASGVPLSFVLSTDIRNAKQCALIENDLKTFREWSSNNRKRFQAFKEATEGKLP